MQRSRDGHRLNCSLTCEEQEKFPPFIDNVQDIPVGPTTQIISKYLCGWALQFVNRRLTRGASTVGTRIPQRVKCRQLVRNAQALRLGFEVNFTSATQKFTQSIYSGLIPVINPRSMELDYHSPICPRWDGQTSTKAPRAPTHPQNPSIRNKHIRRQNFTSYLGATLEYSRRIPLKRVIDSYEAF